MTDSEIVKAFECCNNGWCDNRCPYYGREDIADCREQSGADQLDLINRQHAEIERLNKEVNRLCQLVLYHDGDVVDAVKEFAERLISKAKSAKERFVLESLVESVMREMRCDNESKT